MQDYTLCDVCSLPIGPDKIHIVIDNGHFVRHTYAHRRHRYVRVEAFNTEHTQERTDLEIETLAHARRAGELAVGWE